MRTASRLASVALVGVSLMIGAAIAQTGAKKQYDMNNPDDVIKMDRKMASSLKDGEEHTYYWEGNVYSRVPGEKDRLLFKYWGMNIRASKGFQDKDKGEGWRHVSREICIYLDPVTGKPIDKWKNPWTGEEVDVLHIANDPVNSRGVSWAKGERGPAKFRGQILEDKVIITNEWPLFYSNPLAGDYQDYIGGTYQAIEIFMFQVDRDELFDATKPAAYPTVAWTRVSKWLPWMKMNDRVGNVIFSGNGKKLKGGYNAMPEGIKKVIAERFPEYQKAPPTDDTRPNETSWTVFKKKVPPQKAAGH
ncbi:MAG: DUF1838 domain-containing protein [Nitrosomonadaceae bacterium]|nr:DUF1838 domain-containing protein [Nitrosomonadaceae bacterium]